MLKSFVKRNSKRFAGAGVILLLTCYLFATSALAQPAKLDAEKLNTKIPYTRDYISYGDVWTFDQATYNESKYSLKGGTAGFTWYKNGAAGNTDGETTGSYGFNYFQTLDTTNGVFNEASSKPMKKVDYSKFRSNVTTGFIAAPLDISGAPAVPVVQVSSGANEGVYSVVPDKTGNYYIHAYVEGAANSLTVTYALLDSCADANAFAESGFGAASGVSSATLTRIGDTSWYRSEAIEIDTITWYAVAVTGTVQNTATSKNQDNSGTKGVTNGNTISDTSLSLGGGSSSTNYYYNNWQTANVYYDTVLAVKIPAGASLGPIVSEGKLTLANSDAGKGTLSAFSIFGEEIAVTGEEQTLLNVPIVLNVESDGFHIFSGFVNGSKNIAIDTAADQAENTLQTVEREKIYVYKHEGSTSTSHEVKVTWQNPKALPTISVSGDENVYNFINMKIGGTTFVKSVENWYTVTLDFSNSGDLKSASYYISGDIVNGSATVSGEFSAENNTIKIGAAFDTTTLQITATDTEDQTYVFTYTITPTLSGDFVAENLTTNTKYNFIEDALCEAAPGETVKLLKNASFVSLSNYGGIKSAKWSTNNAGYTVPNGVTLLVPRNADDTGTLYSKGSLSKMGAAFRTLTVPSDITLSVKGTLLVNGAQSNSSTQFMGCPAETYGKVEVQGTIDVYGIMYARGIVSGGGTVKANNGSSVYQLLQFTDFRGGTATYGIYSSVFPMNQFYIQNIQAKTQYYSGCEVYGTYFVTAGGEEKTGDACLIGGKDTSNALFKLSDGYMEFSYDATNAKSKIDLYGEMSIGSFSVTVEVDLKIYVKKIELSTASYIAPLSGAFYLEVKENAVLNIPQKFKLLPGFGITIDEGGTVNIKSGGELYFYDVADYHAAATIYDGDNGLGEAGGYCYQGYRNAPITAGGKDIAETEDALLVVNGTLNVESGGKLYCSGVSGNKSSSIRTYENTGVINMGTSLSNTSIKEGIQKSSGATDVSVSFIPAQGSIVGTDKETYTAFGTGAWYSNGEQWYRHNVIVNGTNNYITADEFSLSTDEIKAACNVTVSEGTFDEETGKITGIKGKEVVVTISAHTEGPIAAVEPDCATPGAEAGTECTVCHKILSGCAEIPALGHSTGAWEYDENGHWKFCSVCETRQEEGSHSYAEDTNQCVCGRIGAFTITFVNEDGSVLQSREVPYGTVPTYDGATPTKEATAQYTYSFAGWTPEIIEVTGEATYTATYTGELNSYTVTWIVDGAETEETYKYGDTPSFKGSTDKAADAQYTYTFAGWDSEPASVTGDITYTAKFNSTVNEYTVTFYDEDGTTVLQSGKVPYGTVPTAPADPTKEATAKYTYTFDGWNAELAEVTGDTSYTAKYSSVVNEYTITFYDEDGTTVLQSGKVAYDDTPAYNGAAPTKEGNAQYSYSFNAWTPAVVAVTGDAAYTATYTETVNKYTVKFVNENGDVLQSSEVAYGDTPTYDGEEPTKEASAQYSYTFKGWNAEVVPVTGEATYTAQFESAVRSYTVTWIVNGVETKETYEYGAVPAFTGSTDKAADAQYSYAFAGWNTEPAEVTGDATYTATYSSTLRTYTVKFVNYDGTELQSEVLDYGETPEYKGETPTKAADAQYTYTFKAWDNQPSEVIADATYKATYSETLNSYTVTFVDAEPDAEGNEVVLDTQTLNYGETPAYTGEIPTKAADAQYTYEFSGWSPAIEAVTGDVKYTAEYSKTVNKYTVTFVNYDGTVLQTGEVAYGEVPAYAGETPTKEADVHDTYSFAGWSPALAPVTDEITYTATFSETSQYYTVEFVNYDGTVLQSGEVEYDATPEYIGETPTKPATAQYSYEFIGWTPDVKPVNGKATYTAAYKEIVNEYTVTFVNDDGTELQSGKVAYGETPAYTGETPTKNPVKHSTYTFDKWTPEIAAVTGDATYKAVYTEVTGECEFTTEIDRVDASCTGPGYYVMQCSCGDTKTFPIEQKAHTGTLQAGQAATCVADGWMDYYVCGGGCGKYFSDAECTLEIADLDAWKLGDGKIAATGVHSFNEKASEQLASAADCVNAATYFVQCDNCDEVSAEKTVAVGEANGHSYGKPVFSWTATTETATSTATFTCTECAEGTEGHAVTVDCSVTEQSRVDAKCDEAGSVTYAASVVFGGETYTASFDVEIPAQHVQLVEYPANPSTCENEGNEAYVECLSCGYSTYKQIPKLPHSFTVEVEGSRTEATCMAEGSVTMKCENCEATEVQTLEINAAAHEWGEVKYTWAEDHSKCTAERVCALNTEHTDTAIAEGEAISSEETKAPTCTEPGKTTYTANFGEGHWAGTASDEAEIEALGHDFGENKDAETCQREECDEPNPELGEGECEHDWGKDGTKLICQKCGMFKFYKSNVIMGNSLDMMVAFPMNAVDNWDDHYVEVVRTYSKYEGSTKENQVTRYNFNDGNWTVNGSYYVVTYPGFAAKEMCDTITLTVYNGSGQAVSLPYEDSIKAYAMRRLEAAEKENNAELKTLVVDLLNYGTQAQIFFGYGEEGVYANSDLTDAQKKYATIIMKPVKDAYASDRKNWLGSNLIFVSNIQFLTAVRGATEDMWADISFTGYKGNKVNEFVQITNDEAVGKYFSVPGIVVGDSRCTITVKVYSDSTRKTVVASFQDSLEAYAARLSNNSEEQKAIVTAFMKFSDSARAYLQKYN